jgi:hypothetical protein
MSAIPETEHQFENNRTTGMALGSNSPFASSTTLLDMAPSTFNAAKRWIAFFVL